VSRLIRNTSKLQCKRCGLCCKELKTIVLFGKELRLFEDIRRSAEELIVIHTDRERIFNLKLKDGGCPRYSEDKGCNNYDKRPKVCRAFPMAASHYQNGFGFMSLDSHLCTATIEFLSGRHNAIFLPGATPSNYFLEAIVKTAEEILLMTTGKRITMERIPTTVALIKEIENTRTKN